MSLTLYFHPLAEDEFRDAYHWYETRAEGLGERFMQEVEERLTDIVNHPEKYPKKKGEYRQTGIRIFPYVIVYKIVKNMQLIFISSIFHTSRNPRKKYRK